MATASLTAGDIPAIRSEILEGTPTLDELRGQRSVEFEEVQTSGPALLVCRPANAREPRPGVLYLHPGGLLCGNNRTGILTPLEWLHDLGVVVVSVEYRLAPEHPDPAPREDALAALDTVVADPRSFGIDPQRLVVAGISAGGGLAAGLALTARDRGWPTLAGQLLICPMLDDRNVTPSSHELHGEGTWDRRSNLTGWHALLGGIEGGHVVSPYTAPARAERLDGLAPAFLDVGAVETFRDEVVDYAVRMWRAGGDAELHVWPGAFHGFDQAAPNTTLARRARAARTEWLRRATLKPSAVVSEQNGIASEP
jgi:acetyl esterase/lipase